MTQITIDCITLKTIKLINILRKIVIYGLLKSPISIYSLLYSYRCRQSW